MLRRLSIKSIEQKKEAYIASTRADGTISGSWVGNVSAS